MHVHCFIITQTCTITAYSKQKVKDNVSVGSEEGEPSQTEVIAQLETLLSAASEELEQQRRLNQALMKRKV